MLPEDVKPVQYLSKPSAAVRRKPPDVTKYLDEAEQMEEEENEKSHESLSIEETNKLRAKLGLKPLNVGTDNGNSGDGENSKEEFVHKPAEDLWKKQQDEKIKEKIHLMKEKRILQNKMRKVKTLGEDDDADDIAKWAEKSRKKEQGAKREAEILIAANEFGIGINDLVKKEKKEQQKDYSGRDLQGLEVEHDLSTFRDGRSEILVIKDKEILAEDQADVLHSVVLQDVEKSKKNLEIKRKGFGYKAYEEEEVDEMGFFKPKSVLDKYDEEIDGEQKGKFTIGSYGRVDTSYEQQRESMKKEIRARGESLKLPEMKLATDYLTAEEIGFKKRKKKVRRLRKRQTLKADDLKPLPGNEMANSVHHGSRRRRNEEKEAVVVKKEELVIDDIDDANDELERALAKQRKMKQKQKDSDKKGELNLAEMIKQEAIEEKEREEETSNQFCLNMTDEFCRKLGSQLTNEIKSERVTASVEVEAANNTHEDMEMETDDEMAGEAVNDNNAQAADVQPSSRWRYGIDVNAEASTTSRIDEEKDDHVAIEAEPIAGKGLLGALKLAQRKGYIETEVAPKGNSVITTNMSTLKAQNYSIEDKNAVDYLDKYAHEKYSKDRSSRHERSGMTMEFNEKKDYKPKIELNYVDERGRNQTPKEAFRKLSHRFHGKGSGKMKQEKRMKKFAEEDAMRHMNSTDTPLNTVAMMREKQRSQSTPYIVLSGGGQTFMSGASSNTDVSKK